jgi:hypothetical protein
VDILRLGELMVRRRRIFLTLVVALLMIFVAAVVLDRYCPASGLGFTESRRRIHGLKNRNNFPSQSDYDKRVTLEALLQRGNDQGRWSETNAAVIEGYVVSVHKGRPELANCYSPCRRDIHINLALRTDAPDDQQFVVEVTPDFQRWANANSIDWTDETLKRTLVGHWCRIEGWLFFDQQHADESANTFKEGSDIWRPTAWEIHPVTKIEVLR